MTKDSKKVVSNEEALKLLAGLKTVKETRAFMQKVKNLRRMDLYWEGLRHRCRLEQKQSDDPLIVDFWCMVDAYEELLTLKNGRTTLASRLRPKVEKDGELRCLTDWALAKAETQGFNLLIDAGLHELTGEWLVVKYASRFPDQIVEAARARLQDYGVELAA